MIEYKAAEFLSSLGNPDTAIILGTGLGIMENDIEKDKVVEYSVIPGFKTSSVSGHAGRLIFGSLGKSKIVAMSGRYHIYEGHTAREVAFPIRVLSLMGVKRLLISNAAGGLRSDLTPGSCMLVKDHINLSGHNPLEGKYNDKIGSRFPEMTEPYSLSLRDKARKAAEKLGVEMKEGVFIQILGPSLETAAETRMLKILGADAVGMSTAVEVIQAIQCKMEVLCISAITNNNDPDNYRCASLEEVIKNAHIASPKIAEIFKAVLND